MKKITPGLRPYVRKSTDFSLAGVFGTPKPTDLPTGEFVITEPLGIKDQGELDDCTGNAVAEVSEDQELVELSPEVQFYLTKILIEKAPNAWGANLMDACLSAVKYGSLTQEEADKYLKNKQDRAEILNPLTWPAELLTLTAPYKKGSVFTVDYPYDVFTNIRAALWANRSDVTGEKRSVAVGSIWYAEWTNAPGGLIPKTYATPIGGHAFKIFGQVLRNGELYLLAQLSNTPDIGDAGCFYFPAEVVNREFGPYGQFMFTDLPKETAEYYHTNNICITDNWLQSLLKAFINLFKKS